MKLKLLRLLFMAVKLSTYGLVLQALFISVLYAHNGNAQYKKVSDVIINQNINGLTIQEVFNLIEENSELELFYIKEDLNSDVQIDLNTEKGISVYDLLMQVSKQSGLKFQQVNNSISASKRLENEKGEDIIQVEASIDVDISGKITDENGNALPGATVVEKGTTNGATTDLEGNYKLSVSEDALLVISFVGYRTEEVNIAGRSSIDLQMTIDALQLDDIVVVGYGTQKKINLTGSVASVKGDDINKRAAITQGSQALQGLASGVFVNTNSGEPGNDDASIIIRGVGTLNEAEPLILIDGIEGDLNSINTTDIETVNVLKDAASAAIYGTRAANGVILVTTKRGQSGKTNVNYNFSYGITSPTVLPKTVTDTRLYLETFVKAADRTGRSHPFTPALIDEISALPNKDWVGNYVNTGSVQKHDFSVSGGSKRVNYRWSTSYIDQQSFLEGDYYLKRLNTRLNMDIILNEKVKIGTSMAFVNSDNRQTTKTDAPLDVNNHLLSQGIMGDYGNKGSFLYQILLVNPPNQFVFDEFGRYGGTGGESSRSQRHNPQAIIDNQWVDIDENQFFGNAFVVYEPIKGLKVRYTSALNFERESYLDTRLEHEQYDRFGNRTAVREGGSLLISRETAIYHKTDWLQASYMKSIGNHNFSLLAGANQEASTTKRIATFEKGFGSTSLVRVGNGTDAIAIQNFDGEWALRSVFGRLNYNYKNKYLLEVNIRRDGSSRFGENNRWGTFPGVSLGYVLSNEGFWNSDIISQLKFRGSWGELGVQSSNLYPFASELLLGSDYNGTSGASLNKLGNPNLVWEGTTTKDIGIDLELLGGKVSLEADYFNKISKGILTDLANPLTSGVASDISINAASIENKGWDMALYTRNNIGDLKISTGLNITHVKNKVIQIDPSLTSNDDRRRVGQGWWIRGEPVNSFFGHEFGGIYQVEEFDDSGDLNEPLDYTWFGRGNPRPGDIKFTDQNGDNIINEDDMVVTGNPNPEWLYGFNTDLKYKAWDFSVLFQGTGTANSLLNRYTGNFGHSGLREYWLNGWTEENRSNTIPAVFVDQEGFSGGTINAKGGLAQTSNWIIDRSYLRLKNIVIGYSLPSKTLRKLSISEFRVFASGQNLWTKTNSQFDDLDPERESTSNHFGAVMPQAKVITLGLSLKF